MNGRGKTTILDAIFLCLYGRKSTEYIVGKKQSYNKVLKDRINKSADDKTTHVKIVMAMDDDMDTNISITRTWYQSDNKISTYLTVEKNGIEDSYLSDNFNHNDIFRHSLTGQPYPALDFRLRQMHLIHCHDRQAAFCNSHFTSAAVSMTSAGCGDSFPAEAESCFPAGHFMYILISPPQTQASFQTLAFCVPYPFFTG